MVTYPAALFPGLAGTPYRVTSDPDHQYNCIAWSAGDVTEWWWPDPAGLRYWPAGIARVVSLQAFQDVFALLGYAPCSTELLELGFEKVAVFALADGTPTHAARQLPHGRWTSKLGHAEDIEHELRALEGQIFGTIALVLKRALPPAP
jgi:hypothetical protein